jgi:hypothetical protein
MNPPYSLDVDNIVRRIRDSVPECRGVAVLDHDPSGDTATPLLANAARVLAESARILATSVPSWMRPAFDRLEILVLSDESTFLFKELRDGGGPTIAIDCSRPGNLGLLLGTLRRELTAIEESI